MFTIKLYKGNGFRQRLLEAESFTILRNLESGTSEITLHRSPGPNGEFRDERFDVTSASLADADGPADDDGLGLVSVDRRYERAIIENAAGKTTEIISLNDAPRRPPAEWGKRSKDPRAQDSHP